MLSLNFNDSCSTSSRKVSNSSCSFLVLVEFAWSSVACIVVIVGSLMLTQRLVFCRMMKMDDRDEDETPTSDKGGDEWNIAGG